MKRFLQISGAVAALLIAGWVGQGVGQVASNATSAKLWCWWSNGGLEDWSPCSATHPLPVAATITPSGTQNVNIAQVVGATAPTGNGTAAGALRVALPTDGTGVVGLNAGTNTIGNVGLTGQFPNGATPITASATGTTGATVATLAANATKTTYICGFTITSDATAALAGAATVTGTITGTLNYIQNVGSATAAGLLSQNFSPCIPGSAVNTGVAVNSVAAGTGGATAVTAWGFQL